MRLGGFVIHGNNQATLAACLADLVGACDEVVAIDTGSNDGSAQLVKQAGARSIAHPWQGFGDARAFARDQLVGCDWLFFLDADERLAEGTRAVVRQPVDPSRAALRCALNDWAGTGPERFLYRTHHRVRLVKRERANWTPAMIVHESTGNPDATRCPVVIEHEFAPDLRFRSSKNELYAWLWATRAFAEQRGVKRPGLQRAFHFLKDAVVKGAALRGGLRGARLAWANAEYHALKYRFLAELKAGRQPHLPALHHRGHFGALFAEVKQLVRADP